MGMDHKELLIRLRAEIATSAQLGAINNDLYAQQMTQLLNACEAQRATAQGELEMLQVRLGEQRGKIAAASAQASLIIEIVAAYNRQEGKRLDEEKRIAEEHKERQASRASQQEQEEQAQEVIEAEPKQRRKPGPKPKLKTP